MVLKLRSYLLIFLAIISMAIYWPIPVLGSLFLPRKKNYYIATAWGRWILFLIRYLLGIKIRVTGKENVPEKACVVLSKHQSALDIFVLLTLFSPQTWVMKKELLSIPFFGWTLAATKPIAINRKEKRRALSLLIERGKQRLNDGFFVLLYPEGTRVPPGKKAPYKKGGVIVAQKTQSPIIPVALNTGLFWQKNKGIVSNGTIDIIIGETITTDNKKTEEIKQEVERWIEEKTKSIVENHPLYLRMKSN